MTEDVQGQRTKPRKQPTQPRAQATVDAIVEAAARILEQRGHERLNTNAVAELAGVSIGTLYQYFPDKEALVGSLIARETSSFLVEAERAADRPVAPDALKALIGAAIEHQLGRRLIDYAAELIATGMPIVIAGDFNVMPTDLDVYKPERWLDDALFAPEIRDAYARLLVQGWTDALRTMHPDETIYTSWDYFRNAYARDAGLRIDHLLLSPVLAPRLVAAEVDRDVRGCEKSSDHAPVWIELADTAASPPRRRRRSVTSDAA